jgi:hypothetical protein
MTDDNQQILFLSKHLESGGTPQQHTTNPIGLYRFQKRDLFHLFYHHHLKYFFPKRDTTNQKKNKRTFYIVALPSFIFSSSEYQKAAL